jgi:hypothetical protein
MNKDMIYIASDEKKNEIASICFDAEIIGFLAIHPEINMIDGEICFSSDYWGITHVESGLSLPCQKCRKHAKQYAETYIAKFNELGGKVEFVEKSGTWSLNNEAFNAHRYARESMQQG